MRLPLDLLLALRYLRPRRNFISIITLLSVLGPLLGVALLLIVCSVMAGFDRDIRNGIMNMTAHITVYPPPEAGVFLQPERLLEELTREGEVWGLRGTPVIEGTALMQVRETVYPIMIRGILPETDGRVSSLQKTFEPEGCQLQEGEAAIGWSLGEQMLLARGDEFLIHSPARLTKNIQWREDGQVKLQEPDEMYLPEAVKVAATFDTGVSDYNDNMIALHLDQAADLFGLDWGSATTLQLALRDHRQAETAARALRKLHPQCQFVTWQERNQLLFDTLQSEKNLMTFLMAFVVLVASFAISATLITVVVQKTREIGILKAMGISSWCVGRIFLLQGLIIGVTGTTLGTIAGLLVLRYRDAIARLLSWVMGVEVFPAEIYHLTSIPALTTQGDLLRTILLAVSISVAAALIPALYAAAANPAVSLKSEN
ncbi:MAG: ABC transporter permease [Oligosphaeraceae bacterium]